MTDGAPGPARADEASDVSVRAGRLLLGIVLLTTAMIAGHLAFSGRPLETHEIFVVQTTREMIASGDYVVPTFGGTPRLQKPPLMYWATAAVARVTGHSDVPEWAPRLVSACAALALVAFAGVLGRLVYDRRTGLVAAAMLACSYGIFSYAGNARPEMLYAACSGLATLGFVRAWVDRDAPRSSRWAYVGWFALGLALLAKGPQLPLLILVGVSVYGVGVGGWRTWARTFRPLRGLGLAFLMVLPWIIAVAVRVEHAGSTWRDELIGLRFGSAESGGSGSGFLSWLLAVLTPEYLLYCASMLLPWGVLLPVAFFVAWERRPGLSRGRILFFAVVAPLVVLSLATHTRDYYLLPILPPLAVLLARGSIDLIDKLRRHNGGRVLVIGAGWTLAVLAFAGAIVTVFSTDIGAGDLIGLGVVFVGGTVIAVVTLRQVGSTSLSAAVVFAFAFVSAMLMVVGGHPSLWRSRHVNLDGIATELARVAGDDLAVLTRGIDPDDMIYRLNRPLTPLAADAAPGDVAARAAAVIIAAPEFIRSLELSGVSMHSHGQYTVEADEIFEIAQIGNEP